MKTNLTPKGAALAVNLSGYLVAALIANRDVRKVTRFISPKFTVKATRVHKADRSDRAEIFVVTIGEPNYVEREFIKLAKKAGEKFPIRKNQLTFWPKVKR